MSIQSVAAGALAPLWDNSGINLRRGQRSSDVRELQDALRALGFDPGPTDGHFGSKTEAAVRNFQRANGLAVDGWVGNQSWRALQTRLQAVAGSAAPSPAWPTQPQGPATPPTPATGPVGGPDVDSIPHVTLRQGSRGPEVRLLQLALIRLGHLPGPESTYADGSFGPVTARAVRSFQRATGITADGVVGTKETWPALQRATGGGVRPSAPSGPPAGEAQLRQRIVDWAIKQANDPSVGYRNYAGRFGNITDSHGRRYFDCSGLVHTAYKNFGIDWGDDDNWTGGMINGYSDFADRIPKDLNQMQPGDLVVARGGGYGHVVMYIGDGKFVGAQTENAAFADQVRVGDDITYYFDKPNAIVLRPRISAFQLAAAASSQGWAEAA